AIAAIVVKANRHGSISSDKLDLRLTAVLTAVGFLVFASIAVRRFASQIGRLVHQGGGPTAGAAIRLILTIVGLIIVVIVTIIMLGVNVTHLLAAGAITGVVIGIAAQQSLGNVFAGIVLMVARPFTVGQRIRIRSGSFGGIFDGEVRALGLTYVDLVTDDGPLKVPNLGMLAAAVGPAPESRKSPDPRDLYVNRSTPKRPPRAGQAHANRRTPPRDGARLPREIIRRVRAQHAAHADPVEPPGGPRSSGGPPPSAPEDGAPGALRKQPDESKQRDRPQP
ncbi:MAG: mechanosensitive ion channel domain-containing protein, partial [Acidimicrobiales bacterium]